MAGCMRLALAGCLAAFLASAGCTRSETPAAQASSGDSAASPSGAAAETAAGAPLAADDPCRLLTNPEVRGIFPEAEAGQRERTREKYGITACIWKTPTGVFALELWTLEENSVDSEIRGLSSAFIDPVNPAARDNVRFETIAGVGEAAMAVVEVRDEQRGIVADVALLVSQRGTQVLEVESSDLPRGDRAAALRALTTLAKLADARM